MQTNNTLIKLKKYKILLLSAIAAIFLIGFSGIALAQEKATDEAKKTDADLNGQNIDPEEIEMFKEKIATEVAKLSKENERAFAGFIKDELANDTLYLITDDKKEIEISVKEDGVEVYSVVKNNKEEIQVNDISKNDYITAYGVYLDNVLNTSIIYKHVKYAVSTAKITDIDNRNFVIDILTGEKDSLVLDIEKNTIQQSINPKSFSISSSGFSQIEVGDTIHFVIQKKATDDKLVKFPAVRLLRIPQSVLKIEKEPSLTPEPTEEKKN